MKCRLFLLCKAGAHGIDEIADAVLILPEIDELYMPIPTMTVLQLFAYYVALQRGCDIDKPRNLAKSVTVE